MRDTNVIIRTSVEEKARWEAEAKKAGKKLSGWIRDRLNDDAASVEKPRPEKVKREPKPPSKFMEAVKIFDSIPPLPKEKVAYTPNPEPLSALASRSLRIHTGPVVCDECKVLPGKIHSGSCGLGNRLADRAKEELNGRS